jgi:hypothetical protein
MGLKGKWYTSIDYCGFLKTFPALSKGRVGNRGGRG